jgi:hypothetical protein
MSMKLCGAHGSVVVSRKVAGSKPDEVDAFFSIYLILLAALGPGVYSASDINEYNVRV